MTIKLKIDGKPDDDTIMWFSKHISPCTYRLTWACGGIGWHFDRDWDWALKTGGGNGADWYLAVDDKHEKILTYWILMKSNA